MDVERKRPDEDDGDAVPNQRPTFSIDEILPPHDSGPWPAGLTLSREQIYDDDGR